MSTVDLLIGGIIAMWIALAIYSIIRNKRNGRNSCGCNCSGCSCAKSPNVTIESEETCDCCRKN